MQIGTLPTQLRPRHTKRFPVALLVNGAKHPSGELEIHTDGKMYLNVPSWNGLTTIGSVEVDLDGIAYLK